MVINLAKGQRIDVGLHQAGFGLGWNPNAQFASPPFDLEAGAVVIIQNGKYELDEDFSTESAVELGRPYSRNSAWSLRPLVEATMAA